MSNSEAINGNTIINYSVDGHKHSIDVAPNETVLRLKNRIRGKFPFDFDLHHNNIPRGMEIKMNPENLVSVYINLETPVATDTHIIVHRKK